MRNSQRFKPSCKPLAWLRHNERMSREDPFDEGMRHRRRVLGDAWVDQAQAKRNAFNTDFQDLITRHAWADIWGRPALGDKTRRFMVLSTLIALGAWGEFEMHVRAALDAQADSALTADEIKEVILQAAIYCGVPAANHATQIAQTVLKEKGLL
jgi:4-carboxymuconolactone decarboxylase